MEDKEMEGKGFDLHVLPFSEPSIQATHQREPGARLALSLWDGRNLLPHIIHFGFFSSTYHHKSTLG